MAKMTPLLNSKITLIHLIDSNGSSIGSPRKYSPDFVPWSLQEEIESMKTILQSDISPIKDLAGAQIFTEDKLGTRTLEHTF